MAMEITNNYSSYAVQCMAERNRANSTKKKAAEETSETTNSNKAKSTEEYVNELAKLVPSVELKVGNSFSTAKSGKTLTINPQLLEKMQNDPEQEKEMKELIKGVESAVNMLDSVMNASGWTVVFKHDYIDENGKYRQIALVRNDFMLNMSDKLREERRKNSEKLIEKSKEKAAAAKEKLEEASEEEKAAVTEEGTTKKASEESAYDRVEQFLSEKMAASKDGTIYLDDRDMRTIIKDAQEDDAGKITVKNQAQIGANLDLKI